MGQNRIAKNLNTVDKFTAPDKPALLWRVQETLNRELNALEPSGEKSSRALNQEEELNALEPSREKSSRALNQEEELNALEPSREKSSRALNQEGEFLPKRRGARGKQIASGCLYPYIKNKKLKNGIIATFPRVEGHRDPNNIDHWYWGYKYKEFVDGEWRNRSIPVPKFRIPTVRFMIDDGMSIAAIKALIKGEFSND